MHPFPPKWKRWLSYLMEMEIETIESIHQFPLTVALTKGRYQLYTDNAIYSFDDLYDNFYKAFEQIALDQIPSDDVLILGFGLGSIPYMLEHHFERQFVYTGVEMDEAVIYLASKYTLPRLKSPVQLIQSRAEIYAGQCPQQFGLICMDVFVSDQVPEVLERPVFLQQLKELLLPNGILLFNRLFLTPEDQEKTRRFYKEVFSEVFEDATYVEVKGNWILLSRNA